MKTPEEYIGSEELDLINDNKILVAKGITGYLTWREGLSNKPRLKTIFAMTSMFLISKNAAAIQDCVENGHADAARSLLRINIETYINLLYVYTQPHNKAYLRLGYSSEMLYLANIDKYEKFTTTTYTKSALTSDDFNNFRKPFRKAKKQWEKLNHYNNIKNVPNLRVRTEEIRNNLGVIWASELYFNSYLFLSEDVHSTPSSIIGLAMRKDYDQMLFGVKEYHSIRDTITIQNEILASTIHFLKKRGLDFEDQVSNPEIIIKYNRHKVYKSFII